MNPGHCGVINYQCKQPEMPMWCAQTTDSFLDTMACESLSLGATCVDT